MLSLLLALAAQAADVPPPPQGSGLTQPTAKSCLPAASPPAGLSPEQLQGGISALQLAIERCTAQEPEGANPLEVRLAVACTGQVAEVDAYDGSGWDPAAIACVMDALYYAPLPAHDQGEGTVHVLTVHHARAQGNGEAPASAAAPDAPGPAVAAQPITKARCDDDAVAARCEDAGDPHACAAWAGALLDVEGRCSDPERARSALTASCTGANSPPTACFLLGQVFEEGLGGVRDRTNAALYYDWACGGGQAASCVRRGALLAGGVGVRRNDRQALRSYRKGCDLGSAEACLGGAQILDAGTFVERDPAGAEQLYARACEASVPEACHGLGTLREAAADPDLFSARDAYEQAVTGRYVDAYRPLARLLWQGLGGKKDRKRAKELCSTACTNGDRAACQGPQYL